MVVPVAQMGGVSQMSPLWPPQQHYADMWPVVAVACASPLPSREGGGEGVEDGTVPRDPPACTATVSSATEASVAAAALPCCKRKPEKGHLETRVSRVSIDMEEW